ncbi:MAG: hypothetical protein ABSA75_07050 [Candidatus Bathyarchaeia archaeon]
MDEFHCFPYSFKYRCIDRGTAEELLRVEKGGEQGISSTQVIEAAVNEEKTIGFIEIQRISYFENLFAVVQINSTNRIASVLGIQSGSKGCSCGVDAQR